jgi:hypothetical protein
MSLSQMAEKNIADKKAQNRAAADARIAQARENAAEKITELLGGLDVPVTYLDTVIEETFKVYNHGSYNEGRSSDKHTVFRFRVDDVTLRLQGGSRSLHSSVYFPAIGYVAVERSCQDCGKLMGVEIDAYIWRQRSAEEQQQQFVEKIGAALTATARCTACAAGVPTTCPSCGRINA